LDDVLKIIEEIQAGIRVEENAEKLYRRFRPGVRSFFQRKGFSPQECDDLTQDVFLQVFKSIETFRRESRFERWLWKISNHVYSNEIRRRRTEKRGARKQSLDLDAAIETKEGPAAALEIPAPGPNSDAEFVGRERSKALHAALKDLPDQMRRCCILRYERGLKYKEIAVVMGISVEAVKAHLHQARKHLQQPVGSAISSELAVRDHSDNVKIGGIDTEDSRRDRIETDLLQSIRERLPRNIEARYKILARKRDSESLTPAEYEELLDISDQIEQLEVQRLESLVRLAKLREVPFETLIEELGLKPNSNG
jgi:RNA polymerase sigma-70 factor, ECF subfamily